MELQVPKGTRDFAPEAAMIRKRVANTLISIFEQYGFCPLETPTFERFDLLASKYAGGAEILKETFQFQDQGKRDLALRYDLTVPLCRFVGMNPMIKLPFKRYHMGEVFRDGPVATARYRQFTQMDVDTIGISEMTADTECILLAARAFEALGLEAEIRFNNRALLNAIITFAGVEAEKADDVILTVDKLEKFGQEAVAKELKEKGISQEATEKIFSIILVKGDNQAKIKNINEQLGTDQATADILEIVESTKSSTGSIVFDPSLARGLSYYTGTILEVFLKNSKVKSAVCAGGRYDKIIGNFLGKGDFPAVGISFGLDRIYDAYVEQHKPDFKTVADFYIAPINTFKESLEIAEDLRTAGVNVAIDLAGKGPSKNFSYANAMNIPYVIVIGQKELDEKQVTIKDMAQGSETKVAIGALADFCKDHN